MIQNLEPVRDKLAKSFKEPHRREDFQAAANVAAFCLLLDVAAKYGCVDVRINVHRCEDLLRQAQEVGVHPSLSAFRINLKI